MKLYKARISIGLILVCDPFYSFIRHLILKILKLEFKEEENL